MLSSYRRFFVKLCSSALFRFLMISLRDAFIWETNILWIGIEFWEKKKKHMVNHLIINMFRSQRISLRCARNVKALRWRLEKERRRNTCATTAATNLMILNRFFRIRPASRNMILGDNIPILMTIKVSACVSVGWFFYQHIRTNECVVRLNESL